MVNQLKNLFSDTKIMNMGNNSICVFCSSSRYLDDHYGEKAAKLAKLLAESKYDLVWGGADIGLMGSFARTFQENKGYITGVIPKKLLSVGLEYKNADELIVTDTMSTRKITMHNMSSAFIALPGGFGTLEEILEVITLKQLKYFNKPVILFNINHFWDKFVEFIDHMITEKLLKPEGKKIYFVTDNPDDVIQYIKSYEYEELSTKW